MHIVHTRTGRYLGRVVRVQGVCLRLDRGEKPLATIYEVRPAEPSEVPS